MTDPFLDDVDLPRFRWWRIEDWRLAAAIRGFDDATCWLLDERPDSQALFETYYKPPLFLFRRTYIREFWEGSSK